MAVILVFFFWPASQAIMQSMQTQDAFGTSTEWVGLENFRQLFDDPAYIESFKTTALFSVLVAGFGIALSLVLAVFADRIVRGAHVLQDLPDPALRGGAGRGRRAVGLHVLAHARRGGLRAAASWASTGTTCSTRRTP